MTTSEDKELILAIPTTLFSLISLFAAIYICVSAYLMGIVRHKKIKQKLYNGDKRLTTPFYHPTPMTSNIPTAATTPIAFPTVGGKHVSFIKFGNNNMVDTSYTSEKDDFECDINHNHNSNSIDSDDACYWERPSLIIHHIFWMSFCDAIFCIWGIALFGPKIFGYDGFNNSDDSTICYIYGLVAQFSICGSVLWYLIVAWCLFSVLFNIGVNTNNFEKDRVLHSIVAWLITGVCCIIPMCFDQYGATNIYSGIFSIRDNEYETECWLQQPKFYLTLYIPVTVAVLFALFVLLAVWKKYYRCQCNCENLIHYCICCPCYVMFICLNYCTQWRNDCYKRKRNKNDNASNSNNNQNNNDNIDMKNYNGNEHYDLKIDINMITDYGATTNKQQQQRRWSKSSALSKMSQKTYDSRLSRHSKHSKHSRHSRHSHHSHNTYIAYDKDKDDASMSHFLNDEWIICDGCRQKCIDIFILNEDRASISEFGYVDTSDYQIISRLTLFTVVFVLIWTFPIVNRVYQAIARQSPFWLTMAHHVSLALIGSANAFVWSRSKTFRSIATSYHTLVHDDRHISDELLTSELENAIK